MKTKIKEIGLVPVESGAMLIADPCYSLCRDKNTVDVLTFEEYIDEKLKKTHKDESEEIKLSRDNIDYKEGILIGGFGGDGAYPVSIEIIDDKNSFWNGYTKSVTITFIESEDRND